MSKKLNMNTNTAQPRRSREERDAMEMLRALIALAVAGVLVAYT